MATIIRDRFAIVSTPRTGSSLLHSVLNKHPEISCHGEIFNQYNPGYAWPTFPKWNLEHRDNEPLSFLEYIYTYPYYEDVTKVGYKVHIGQNIDAIAELQAQSSVKKIVLYRKDLVARFVSEMLMKQGAIVNSQSGVPSAKIYVDPAQLEDNIAETKGKYNSLQFSGTAELFVVAYEDLQDYNVRKAIMDFLGVQDDTLIFQDIYTKVTPPLDEVVLNWDVISLIDGTYVLTASDLIDSPE